MKMIARTALTMLAACGLATGAHAKTEQCAAITKPQVESWFTTFNKA
jgi:ABC-type sugar transport system substrate-binding protein